MISLDQACDCPAAVRDWLLGSENITNQVANRCYPDGLVPQGEKQDRIVLTEISFTPDMYLGGESGSGETVLQIDYWADGQSKRAKAKLGGELIRNRMSGYRGALNEFVTAACCELIRGPEVVAMSPTDGSASQRYRCSSDYRIRHTTPVPDFS